MSQSSSLGLHLCHSTMVPSIYKHATIPPTSTTFSSTKIFIPPRPNPSSLRGASSSKTTIVQVRARTTTFVDKPPIPKLCYGSQIVYGSACGYVQIENIFSLDFSPLENLVVNCQGGRRRPCLPSQFIADLLWCRRAVNLERERESERAHQWRSRNPCLKVERGQFNMKFGILHTTKYVHFSKTFGPISLRCSRPLIFKIARQLMISVKG